MNAIKQLQELLANPPVEIVELTKRVNQCDDPHEAEELHLKLSLSLGQAAFQEHLRELDPAPTQCPHCAKTQKKTPAKALKSSGVSLP
jgi:hypothetical protein